MNILYASTLIPQEQYHPTERNAMGLIDPNTGSQYSDIISAHLQLRKISVDDWLVKTFLVESEARNLHQFKILLNHKTLQTLLQNGEINALVSFQTRTSGRFAVARIFEPSIIPPKKKASNIYQPVVPWITHGKRKT